MKPKEFCMLKNFKLKFKKNIEIFGLIFLIFFTAIFVSYFNYKKKKMKIIHGEPFEKILESY